MDHHSSALKTVILWFSGLGAVLWGFRATSIFFVLPPSLRGLARALSAAWRLFPLRGAHLVVLALPYGAFSSGLPLTSSPFRPVFGSSIRVCTLVLAA